MLRFQRCELPPARTSLAWQALGSPFAPSTLAVTNCWPPPGLFICAAAAAIAYSGGLSGTSSLQLDGNQLSADVVPSLCLLLAHPSCQEGSQRAPPRIRRGGVRELLLTGNRLGDSGVGAMCQALRYNNTLERLRLSGNCLGPASGAALGSMLVTNRHLQHLSVSYTELGSKGTVDLCGGVKSNTSLRGLFLGTDRLDGTSEVAARSMLLCREQARAESMRASHAASLRRQGNGDTSRHGSDSDDQAGSDASGEDGGGGGGSCRIPSLQMGTLGLDMAARQAALHGGMQGGLQEEENPFIRECMGVLQGCNDLLQSMASSARQAALKAAVQSGEDALRESDALEAAQGEFEAIAHSMSGSMSGDARAEGSSSGASVRRQIAALRQQAVNAMTAAAAAGDAAALHDMLPLLYRRLYLTANHMATSPMTDHTPPRLQTPLIAACRGGHEEAVQELLDFYVYSDPQVDFFPSDVHTMYVAAADDQDGGASSAEVPGSPSRQTSGGGGAGGRVPLSWKGSGMAHQDSHGRGPLYHAARCGHKDIVHQLLSAWEFVSTSEVLGQLQGLLAEGMAGALPNHTVAARMDATLEKASQRRVRRLLEGFKGAVGHDSTGAHTELASWLVHSPAPGEAATELALAGEGEVGAPPLHQPATVAVKPSDALTVLAARIRAARALLAAGCQAFAHSAGVPGGAGLDPSEPLFPKAVHRQIAVRLSQPFAARLESAADEVGAPLALLEHQLRSLDQQAAGLLGPSTEHWTALMHVCGMAGGAPVSLVRYMVEVAGANVNVRSAVSGDSALSIAFRTGNWGIARYLASLDDVDMFPDIPPQAIPVITPMSPLPPPEAPNAAQALQEALQVQVQMVVFRPLPSDVRFHRILSSLLPTRVQSALWGRLLEVTNSLVATLGKGRGGPGARSATSAEQPAAATQPSPFLVVPVTTRAEGELERQHASRLSTLRFLLDSGFDASQLSFLATSADNVYTAAAARGFEQDLVSAVHGGQAHAVADPMELLDTAAHPMGIALHHDAAVSVSLGAPFTVTLQLPAHLPGEGGGRQRLAHAGGRQAVDGSPVPLLVARALKAVPEASLGTPLPVPLPCFPHLVASLLFKRGARVSHVLTGRHAADAQQVRLLRSKQAVAGSLPATTISRLREDPVCTALHLTPHHGEAGTGLPLPRYALRASAGAKVRYADGQGSTVELPPLPPPPPGVLAWGRIPFLDDSFISDSLQSASSHLADGWASHIADGRRGVADPTVAGLITSWVPFVRVGPRCNVRQLFLWLIGSDWGASHAADAQGMPLGHGKSKLSPLFGMDVPSTLISVVDSQDQRAGRLGSATRDLVREVAAAAGDGKAWIITDGSADGADGFVAQVNAQSSRPRPVIGMTNTPPLDRMAALPTHWFAPMPPDTQRSVLAALTASLGQAADGRVPGGGSSGGLSAQCWTPTESGLDTTHSLFIFVDEEDTPGTPIRPSAVMTGSGRRVRRPSGGPGHDSADDLGSTFSSGEDNQHPFGSTNVAVDVPTVAHLLGFQNRRDGLDSAAVGDDTPEEADASPTPDASGDHLIGAFGADVGGGGVMDAAVHLSSDDVQPSEETDEGYLAPVTARDLALPRHSPVLAHDASVAAAFRRSFEMIMPLHAAVRFVIGGDLTDLVMLYHSSQLTSYQQLSPGFSADDRDGRLIMEAVGPATLSHVGGGAQHVLSASEEAADAVYSDAVARTSAAWSNTAAVLGESANGSLMTSSPTVLLGTHTRGENLDAMGNSSSRSAGGMALAYANATFGLASTLADLSLERSALLAQARYSGSVAFAPSARSLVRKLLQYVKEGVSASLAYDAGSAPGAATSGPVAGQPGRPRAAAHVAAFAAARQGAEALAKLPTPCLAVDEALLAVREVAARTPLPGVPASLAWAAPSAGLTLPPEQLSQDSLSSQWLLPSETFPPILVDCLWQQACAADPSNANPLFPLRRSAFCKLAWLVARTLLRRQPMTYAAVLAQYGSIMAQCWGKARAVVQAGFATAGGARSCALGEVWHGAWRNCFLQQGSNAAWGGGLTSTHSGMSVSQGVWGRAAVRLLHSSTPSAGGGTGRVGRVIVIERIQQAEYGSRQGASAVPAPAVLQLLGADEAASNRPKASTAQATQARVGRLEADLESQQEVGVSLSRDQSTQRLLALERELGAGQHDAKGEGGAAAVEASFVPHTSASAIRLRTSILRRLAPSPGQPLHEGQGREWLKMSALWDCDTLIHEVLSQRRRARRRPMPKSERVVLADVLSFAWLEDDPVLVNILLKNGLLEDPHPFHLLSRQVCNALDTTALRLTSARSASSQHHGRRFVLPTAHASTRLVTERLLHWYTAFVRFFDGRTLMLEAEVDAARRKAEELGAPSATATATPAPEAVAAAVAHTASSRNLMHVTSQDSMGHGGPPTPAGVAGQEALQDARAAAGITIHQKPRWLAECQEALRVLRIVWAAVNGKFRVAIALLSHTTQPLRTALLVTLVLRRLADQGSLSQTSVLNDVEELQQQGEVFESLAIKLLTAVHDESVSIHWTEKEKAQAAMWLLTPAEPAWAIVDAALAVLLAPYHTNITRTFLFTPFDPLYARDVLGWALQLPGLSFSGTHKNMLKLAVRAGCRRFLALDVVQLLISNVWNSGVWLHGEAQATLLSAWLNSSRQAKAGAQLSKASAARGWWCAAPPRPTAQAAPPPGLSSRMLRLAGRSSTIGSSLGASSRSRLSRPGAAGILAVQGVVRLQLGAARRARMQALRAKLRASTPHASASRDTGGGWPLADLTMFLQRFRLQAITRNLAGLGVRSTLDVFALRERDRQEASISPIHWARLLGAMEALRRWNAPEAKALAALRKEATRRQQRQRPAPAIALPVETSDDVHDEGASVAFSSVSSSTSSRWGVASELAEEASVGPEGAGASSALSHASGISSSLHRPAADRRPGFELRMEVTRQAKVRARVAALFGEGEGLVDPDAGKPQGDTLMSGVRSVSGQRGIMLSSAAQELALMVLPQLDLTLCGVGHAVTVTPQAMLLRAHPRWATADGQLPGWAQQAAMGSHSDLFMLRTVPAWWTALSPLLPGSAVAGGEAQGAMAALQLRRGTHRDRVAGEQSLVTELAAWTRLLVWALLRSRARSRARWRKGMSALAASLHMRGTLDTVQEGSEAAESAGVARGAPPPPPTAPPPAPPLATQRAEDGGDMLDTHAVARLYSSGQNVLGNMQELLRVLPPTLVRVYSVITAPVRDLPSVRSPVHSRRGSATLAAQSSQELEAEREVSSEALQTAKERGVLTIGRTVAVRVAGILMGYYPLGNLDRFLASLHKARALQHEPSPPLQWAGVRWEAPDMQQDIPAADMAAAQAVLASGTAMTLPAAAAAVAYAPLWTFIDVMRLGRQVAHAVAVLHDAGVLHCDLCSANVLLRCSDSWDEHQGLGSSQGGDATAHGHLAAKVRRHSVLDLSRGVRSDSTRSETGADAPSLPPRPVLHACVANLGNAVLVQPSGTNEGKPTRRLARSDSTLALGGTAASPGVEPLQFVTLPSSSEPRVRWGAPETLGAARQVSRASDVYAFGVLLWEMCTGGQLPWRGDSEALVKLSVAEGMTLESRLPKDTPPGLRSLIASCWALDPEARPSMHALARRLKRLEQAAFADLEQAAREAKPAPFTRTGTFSGLVGLVDVEEEEEEEEEGGGQAAGDAARGNGEEGSPLVSPPTGPLPLRAQTATAGSPLRPPPPSSAEMSPGFSPLHGPSLGTHQSQQSAALSGTHPGSLPPPLLGSTGLSSVSEDVWSRAYMEGGAAGVALERHQAVLEPGAPSGTRSASVIARSRLGAAGRGSTQRRLHSDSDEEEDAVLEAAEEAAAEGGGDDDDGTGLEAAPLLDPTTAAYGPATPPLFPPAVKHAMYGMSELAFAALHSAVLLTSEGGFANHDACCASEPGVLRDMLTCDDNSGGSTVAGAHSYEPHLTNRISLDLSIGLRVLLFWWSLSAALSDLVGGGAGRFRLLLAKANMLKYALTALAAVCQVVAWMSRTTGSECLGYLTDILAYGTLIILAFISYPLLLEYLSTGAYLGPRVFTIANGAAFSMVDVFIFLLLFALVVASFIIPLISIYVVSPFGNSSVGDISALLWSVFGDWELPVDFAVDSGQATVQPLVTLGVSMMALYLIVALIILLNILIAVLGDSYQTARDTSRGAWNVYRIEMLWRYLQRSSLPPPCYFPAGLCAVALRRSFASCIVLHCPSALACCLPRRLRGAAQRGDPALILAARGTPLLSTLSCMCCGVPFGAVTPRSLQPQRGVAERVRQGSLTAQCRSYLFSCCMGCRVEHRVNHMLSPTDPAALARIQQAPPGMAATARIASVRVFGASKL